MATDPQQNGESIDRDLLSIDDPEQLSQKKRINQILSRREDVIDARNEAIDAYLAGDLGKQQAVMAYQSRIEGLIADIWTKFKNADNDLGKELLFQDEIAEVEVPPPAEIVPDSANDIAAGADPPTPKTRSIYGLKWFIENDPIVTAQFTVHSWNPPGQKTAVGQRLLDFGTLDEALLKIMEFLDETGIDADLEDDQDDAEFDYSDLLDPDGDDPE